MNSRELFGQNIACPARGQAGKENIRVHSQKDKRCICEVCGQTFTTTTGTIFYRLRSDPQLEMWVIVLLAYGCPLQAIVKAFGLDERTVGEWQTRAGKHCQQVHEHPVENSQHDLEQAQADEIKVEIQKSTIWMALAI
jgi:transposase-like protein